MASSSSPSQLMKDEEPINWAELPQELTSSILLRLGVGEILLSAQRVCRSWRRVCKNPSMWRIIDMRSLGFDFVEDDLFDLHFDSLCRQAVDFSQGTLLEINISHYCTDDLLHYIADRSSSLRSLALDVGFPVTNEGLVNAIKKLPLLETLDIPHSVSKLNLKAIGEACPQLQTLKLNSSGYMYIGKCDDYVNNITQAQ